MSLRKITQLIAALILGLVLTLSSHPAHSQGFPTFQDCFNEVDYYEDYADLDAYNDQQIYCLFVVELIGGGIDVDRDYENEQLKQFIWYTLGDADDIQDGDTFDDDLTYAEIAEEFPGNELTDLISDAVLEADRQSRLFQSSPFHTALSGVIPDVFQISSLKQYNGRSRAGYAVQNVSYQASQRRRP